MPRGEALDILHEGAVIPATPLALDATRRFDEKRQRLLTRYYLEAGVGGIATAVHTTQFAIRHPAIALFEPVLRTVADEAARYERETGGTVVKIAGACGDTPQAVGEARMAQRLGYDAVLLSPGGLGALSEDALLERTRAVAAVMPVVGFYLQAAVGGRAFSYDYWERLCAIDNVVAIKAAPFNRYQTLDVMRAAASSPRAAHITLYTGNDDNIVADLLSPYRFERGGRAYEARFSGGLLGHWSVWARGAVTMFEAVKSAAACGSVPAELLALALQVTDANKALFDAANGFKGCIAGLHEVLRRQGLMEGIWCLDPDEALSPGQTEEIDRVCAMYPHLCDDAFVSANIDRWKRMYGIAPE